MAYISGSNIDGVKSTRKQTFVSSIFFVLGFSLVFAILGILLNTVLGSSAYTVRVWLERIAGLIIILFAIHILGLIKIPFLMMEHKLEVKRFKSRYFTAFIFGASFAVGWSPCVGAILGSVFALAVSNPGTAFILLMAYAVGLGIPFLIVGLFTEESMRFIRRSGKVLKYFNIIVGILMLALGVLVFTDNLNLVSNLFLPWELLK